MSSSPSGTVTFLLTDIEGSTILSQKYPAALQESLEKHNKILRETIEANNGFIFEIVGDAFCSAFTNTVDAVRASTEIQVRLQNEKWNEAEIRIRMGIHRGNADWNGKRYIGYTTLAKTNRLISVSNGGQILISGEALESIEEKDFHKIEFKDLGERRLKDIIQPVRIYQILSEHLRTDFPPLKTLDMRHNNLPVQLTSFIGREGKLRKIKTLLKSTHLLTLKGPGGAGKTRIALKAGSEIIDEFSDGAWFIDFTTIRDENLVPHMFASVLKVGENPKVDLRDSIIEFLKEKQALIILDNCEHLIGASADIAERLLMNCPKLKIIATSREALNCHGEVVFNVQSLKLPEPGKKITPSKLTQYEAVKLFIQRSLSVNPEFEVNNKNAAAVAGICQQLDGIPLAIELAAAKMKVLSPEKIYERLNDRFKFLTGGVRTAFPRQQTLKSMVDWSYDLLSEKEKTLLIRLSVFSDGCTLEAAEKVCSDEDIDEGEVLEILTNLVDKSLVIFVKEKDRYKILETIREYGEDKLVERRELEEIVLKHLSYFIEFTNFTRDKLAGALQKDWITALETESPNFQLALTTAITRNKKSEGLHLANSLARFWEIRGYISSGKKWFEEIISGDEDLPKLEKANGYLWLGTYEWITGNYDKAQSYYEKGFEMNNELDNKRGVAVSLNNMGLVSNIRGEFEESRKYAEESYKLLKEIGDEALIADGMMNLASVLVNLKEYEKAKSLFEDTLVKYKELGDSRGQAMVLVNLGNMRGLAKEYEAAKNYFEESLAIQMEIGDTRIYAVTLRNLAVILDNLGQTQKAKDYIEESIKMNKELGDKRELSSSYNSLGFIYTAEGKTEKSKELHKDALRLQLEIGDKSGIIASVTGLVEVILNSNPSQAAALLGAGEGIFPKFRDEIVSEFISINDNEVISLKEKLGDSEYIKNYNEGKDNFKEQLQKLNLMSKEQLNPLLEQLHD